MILETSKVKLYYEKYGSGQPLILFFNPVLTIWFVGTILMLHLQILQEEECLVTAFGEKYVEYRKCVGRYLGRSKQK